MSLSSQRAGWSQLRLFRAVVLVALTPVAGVEPWGLEPRRPRSRQFLSCLPFWWSRRGLSKVSAHSEQWGGMVRAFWERNGREPRSLVWFSIGFKVEWWPRGQQASILQTHKERFRAALASAVIAFLMAWSQVSFSQSFCLAWARIEGLTPLQNRRIKTGSEITASASDSRRMVCKCSKWAA